MVSTELNNLIVKALNIIKSYGGIIVSKENKMTLGKYELPKIYAGNQIISGDFTIVDEIKKKINCLCSFLQIIPEGLIRISTTIEDNKGDRVIGTIMDNSNPICISIKKGFTELGRGWVINEFYETIDLPLYDEDGNLVAAFGIGKTERSGEREVVLFCIEKCVYGFYIMFIDEIIEMPDNIIRTTKDNENIIGLFSLQGEAIPLIDTTSVFGFKHSLKNLEETYQQKVLIVQLDARKYGLLVDKVIGLAKYDLKDIQKLNLPEIDLLTSIMIKGTLQNLKNCENVIILSADLLIKIATHS